MMKHKPIKAIATTEAATNAVGEGSGSSALLKRLMCKR